MIEHISTFPDDVMGFVFHGQITKTDYDAVFISVVCEALKRNPKVRLYYETAAHFTGFDVGAMWDDAALGMEHIGRWDRAAVVTEVKWMEQATRLSGFIFHGSVRLFPRSDTAAARVWIMAPSV
jgi:hypothetical protein